MEKKLSPGAVGFRQYPNGADSCLNCGLRRVPLLECLTVDTTITPNSWCGKYVKNGDSQQYPPEVQRVFARLAREDEYRRRSGL